MANRAKRYASRKKFDRINELNKMQSMGGNDAVGARAAKKASNQTWIDRDMRPGTMHKQSNSKPSVCKVVSYV